MEKIVKVRRKTWKEFKDSGLLWFINTILHAFGWVIAIEDEDAYPARASFRGFSEESNTKGYQKLSKYLAENSQELLKEANEE